MAYSLPAQEIPLNNDYDVIVAGGGPAGCAAAAAAAREGAKTLLVEVGGALGGMGTQGLVPAWCPFTDGKKVVYRGLAEKVFRTVKDAMPHVRGGGDDWVAIDPERLKRVYDELVTGAGADVLFNTFVTGVRPRPDNARAADVIITANKAGLTAWRAKVFVDCTGDADLVAWLGGEYDKGGENHELQGSTLCFILSNVDSYAYANQGRPNPNDPNNPIHRLPGDGKYPLLADTHSCNSLLGAGTVGFNAGHLWDIDSTDPLTVSAGLVKGRQIAAEFRDAMAEYFPAAFGNAFLAATAPALGVRESRRILGDYYLTVDDLKACRDFPDNIGRNCYFIDVHRKDGGAEPFRFPEGKSHGIPYRSLLPAEIPNVIVAGRTLSSDRWANGSLRVMPVCLVTGEAAGTAAALAAAANGDFRAVDTAALQKSLTAHGAFLYDAE